MFLGIAQILVGLVIEMGNYIVNHKMQMQYLHHTKIAFFIGGIYIIYITLTSAHGIVAQFLQQYPIVVLIFGKPAYLAIAKPAQHEPEEMDGIANRLFEARLLHQTIRHTISYQEF
jgi:vacuolar-type H+-ATPase subunit I/STV1